MKINLVIKILLGLAVIISSIPVYAQNKSAVELEQSIDIRKTELETIQDELKGKRLKLQFLKDEEKSHLEKLYNIEEQLNLNNRLITKIRKQIKELNILINELELKLKDNIEELAKCDEILSERLIWIYKRSRVSPWLTALSAGDLLQGARRLYLFSLLNKYDRKMIKEIDDLNQQIKLEREDLISRKNSTITLKRDKENTVRNIQTDRREKKRLLEKVRTQKNVEQQTIQQLAADQKRISEIIEVLLQNQTAIDKKAAEEFLKLKGKLIWPVHGKIIRQFGRIKDKKYNTVITNPGIDIKARVGAPVTASTSGSTAHISWLRGYGSFVILNHGGSYYTLYSHLDEIFVEKGQYITAGENLGTVSDSGISPEPVLHFELRKGKEQLDPVLWLR